MKSTLLTPLLALGVLAGGAAAQVDQAELQARYEKKLQKEFISHGGWMTDYDEARERAQKEGKMIFAYFSRSYAP
jgi:hypothetical protein